MPASLIERAVPALAWLRGYRRADLGGDLTAGATVAVMLVPQAMAYAMLAGLPPAVGLYAATVPVAVYAVFGASRHLAVGPVAMVSLLVASGCAGLAEPGSSTYVALAGTLALLVGITQFALGIARLGVLVSFVSHAVISGFTSAAAIVIALSQVRHLIGVKTAHAESFVQSVANLMPAAPSANLPTVVMGAVCIAALVLLGRVSRALPAGVVVCALATGATALFHLDGLGIATVGDAPAGLPPLTIPHLDISAVARLAPTALTISLIGFVESYSVAKYVASQQRLDVQPSQELVGLGLANVAAAFFGGYPVTGGLSRTAVNYRAGAKTGLAGLVTAALVLLAVALLTPLFRHLPTAVLGAIIVVAVSSLVNPREAVRLFRVRPGDGWVMVATFVATLVLGVETGLVAGVALSLAQFVWRSARPHIAELGWVESGVYRNVARFPDARVFDGCAILRIDASLYFANMGFVDARARATVSSRPSLRWLVLDLSAVNDVDAVGVHMLEDLMEDCAGQDIEVLLAGMKGPVRDVVARAGWEVRFGQRMTYRTISAALRHAGALEECGCPARPGLASGDQPSSAGG